MHVLVQRARRADGHGRGPERGPAHQAAALEARRRGRGGLAAGGLPDPGGGLSGVIRGSGSWPGCTRGPHARAWALLAPGALWLLVFFLVPILIMFVLQPDAARDLRRGGARLHPGALPAVLRPAVPRRSSGARSSGRVACTVICLLLGYPVAYAIARGRPVAELPALPGGAAVLDQLPGPHLRHDLPAARHRADQQLARAARADRGADHHALHPVRGDGGPGVRLPAVHDPADLRLAGEARPLAAGGGRGARGAAGRRGSGGSRCRCRCRGWSPGACWCSSRRWARS